MKLEIDDDYQIVSDSLQYILQEKKVIKQSKDESKIGTEYYENVGYHGKIHSALKAYKELSIRNSEVTTITELMEFVKNLDKKIDKFLNGN